MMERLRPMLERLRRLFSPRVTQIAFLFVLAVAAVMLANAEAGNQVAADADVIVKADSVAQAATISYASADDVVLIAQAHDQGLVTDGDFESAVDTLRSNVSGLVALTEDLGAMAGDHEPLLDALDSFETQTEAIASAVESGDTEAALLAAGDQFETSYETLSRVATGIRSDYQGRIDTIREGLGHVATAARFLVALIIPAGALVFLYAALRRRQRESLIVAELSREKALRKKKDEFLASASHHLNTPLSVVLGFAEMLRDNGRDYNAAVRTEMIELMAMQAAEASNVAEDLLIAGRADMGELTLQETSIDLRSVFEKVTRDWDSEHRARLTITGNALATGDAKRVHQVLRNLLKNAVGHGGTKIDVEISQLFNKALVEVSDDGEGIPEGHEEKVFQAYYRQSDVNGVPPSLGLGLSVSRRLARAMGGDVKYRRDSGVTTFEFSLPRSYEHVAEDLPDVDIDPTRGEPNSNDILEIVRFGGPRVVFQPMVDLRKFTSGEDCVVGYEALSRFPFGSPPAWFKAAKASNTHVDLELACIVAAIDQFTSDRSDHFLALNVSDSVLVSSRLNESLEGIDPGRLVLELSEQASISSYEATAGVTGALAERGVRLAVDDVGAAEIDLWHVIRLSASIVKIDMSLVREVNESPAARSVIRSLVALAEELGVIVVAEGVESESEHMRLLELGVGFGQGYLYGKPEPLTQAAAVGLAAHVPSAS
jgi:signal transduction histidine kinase/EAL domain-containing protein (putative c-di-GMP-specific phosphodiesterase class I)